MTMLAMMLASMSLLISGTQDDPITSTTRGITGRVLIESDSGVVRGRPDLDLDSPILVRLAKVEDIGEGRVACELEFIGVDAGVFDLRDVLVFENGVSIDRLDPIPVEIVSNLARDAPTDLVLVAPPPALLEGGYSAALLTIGIVWVLIPVVVIVRRLFRPRPEPELFERGPTLAEKIAPLIESASQRELSIAEQGRLELLLYAHWQERLNLGSDRPNAVAQLRRHETAGRLLRAVERWLHEPHATAPSRSEIASLLEPYRHIPAGGVE